MKRALFLAAFLACLPLVSHAAEPDLGITAGDIRFSKSTLVSGETIRVYGAIKNHGDVDTSAYVFFYQGSQPIDASQVVTVSTGGIKDEVWVDFTVPYGSFNIRAEIKGQDPGDIDASNDIAITNLFSPIIDEDRDGIEDGEDNCPDAANVDQADADGDGSGDACDDDDDNDGLTDGVEDELGTDQANPDTDGDGTDDAKDAAPTDPTTHVTPAPQTTTEEPSAPPDAAEDSSQESEHVSEDDTQAEAEEEEAEDASLFDLFGDREPAGIFQVSTNAAFVYLPIGWKQYRFRALLLDGTDIRVQWDFGDGVTSAQPEVDHTYLVPGSYTVTLTVTDETGQTTVDSQDIRISFFHIANPYIQLLIGLLALLLLTSLMLSFKRGKEAKRAPSTASVKRLSMNAQDAGAEEADTTPSDVEESESLPEEEELDEPEEADAQSDDAFEEGESGEDEPVVTKKTGTSKTKKKGARKKSKR